MIKYDRKKLEKIVLESNSISEVLRKLEISTRGRGGTLAIKKYIKEWNISTSHFLSKSDQAKLKFKKPKKVELQFILISGSTYMNLSSLKKRLYKAGLKKRRCEICNQNEEWKEMKISLVLDHKNGIYNDNRIENLRMLCPNCNAGQETFCRGSKGKFTKEKKQNNRLYNRKVKNRPSHEILKDEVRKLGFVGTGRKYGVSDNSIRKWIKFYEKINS